MMLSLTASCGPNAIQMGDFCAIAEPLQTSNRELAVTIVQQDRDLAKGLNRHNAKVGECGK